jgi:hypothetical protein
MLNLFNLVQPSGTLILSALNNTKSYRVGPRYFPSAQVTEQDMYLVLNEGNFVQKTLDLQIIPVVEWAEEGFESIIVVRAQKRPSVYTSNKRLIF